MDLSIIIVNWNSADYVCQCVDSIRKHTSGITYEVLVIDNASYDGCDQKLRELHPDVIYIQSGKNLGFARANNLAYESSKGEFILFLNPDTEVVGPAIVQLRRALQELPSAGAAGARLLNSDGTLQTSCIQSFPTIINQMLDSEYFQKKWPHSDLWGTAPLHRSAPAAETVEVISGACVMVRREVFEKIGRFSEDYFMYAEDADLCHKVEEAGWKNYYVPEATVVHFGGGSSRQAVSNFSAVMMRESIWRFLRKRRGGLYALFYRAAMLFLAFCRLCLLGLLMPIQALRRGRSMTGSFRKWWAILRWSIRREAWVRNA